MHARTHIAGTAVNTASNAPSAALPLIPTQFTQASLIPKMSPSTRTATPKMLMKRADGAGQSVALVGDTYSDVLWGDTQILSQIALRVTQQRLLAPKCRLVALGAGVPGDPVHADR